MYEMQLTTGKTLVLDETNFQIFKGTIGTGPRFVELTVNGVEWIVSKDHIVTVHKI